MQSIDFSQLNAPIFAVSTISEMEEKLNKDEIFQKELPTKLKQDITGLIRFWNAKCLEEAQQVTKGMNQEFTNGLDNSSKVSTLIVLVTPSMEESENGDLATPVTPPTLDDQVQFEPMADHQENKDDAVLENKNEIAQLVKVKTPGKSIKKSLSSFVNRIKCAFAKKTKVDPIKITLTKNKGASTKTPSTKTKSKNKKVQERKPLDLAEMECVEPIFNRSFGPDMASPQRLFLSKSNLEKDYSYYFGGRDDAEEQDHVLCMSMSNLVKDYSYYFGGLDDAEDQGHVSKDSFLEEFEARQRNGVFSYMDKYVEPPMSECEDSSNNGSLLQVNRAQILDEATNEGKRSSGDQLLDDIWKQSEEYQEYLSHETEDGVDDDNEEGGFYGMNLKTVAGKRNISSSIWRTPCQAAYSVVETIQNHVVHSQTEVNMEAQDLANYVKIEASQAKEHRIPRKKVKPLVAYINDGALCKRPMSAYSSLKDYDLVWQKAFHDEQQDLDKVQS